MLSDLIFRVIAACNNYYERWNVSRLEKKYGCKISYVNQGNGGIVIVGDGAFFIDETSHLKSNTFIECSGGVHIGKYFHVGRGLTIFSSKHDYRHANKIPYDEKIQTCPVVIEDFVWIGANVSILPGVTIGEGAIVGAGSIVTKDVKRCSVVLGPSCEVKSFRDEGQFDLMKQKGMFY